MKTWLVLTLAGISNALVVTGQLLWKQGAKQTVLPGISILKMATALLSNSYFWLGVIVYTIATALWIYLLSKNPLSYLYAMTSIGYIFSVFAGWYILGEHISHLRIIGVIIIIIGVIVVSRS